MVTENLLAVEENIQRACQRAGRDRKEVTLIAVSKTKPVEMIQEAMKSHITTFGENKVQELLEKQKIITQPLDWHLIGHLQRNKVKQIVGRVTRIHSVDSLRLAKQIQNEFEKSEETAHILVEVNMAKEESKFGLMPEETEDVLREIAAFPNIRVHGLMTIAPYVENPEENRIHFRNLHKLLVDINRKNIDNINMDELSMGMTGDYEVAIEEGATYIRVGTGIFGNRIYIS
jgi:pyridoxal phosphate enzyme, YggS family